MAATRKKRIGRKRPLKIRLRRTTIALSAVAGLVLAMAAATALTTDAFTSPSRLALPQPTATPATPVGSVPCGVRSERPLRYDHIVLIMMENHDLGQVIGSPNAPFLTSLANQCGSATNYSAIGDTVGNSLPNYLGLTSGTAPGGPYSGRCDPITCNTDAVNIFSQLEHAGKTWKAYQESMRANCELFNDGRYAVRHNPAPYYTNLKSTCLRNDVPMGNTVAGTFITDLTNNTLPDFAFITPDLCHDTHDCAVSAGDAWMKLWLPKILSSPGYQAGNTAIFITYDEGHKAEIVPFVAIAPTIPPGTSISAPLSHYALLHTMQQMLGLSPYLGNAGTAPSMRADFHL